METNPKIICGVCSGKGGWKKEVHSHLDDKWNNCPYCDGYGFIDAPDDNAKKNEAHILKYNHYKKLITELLSDNTCRVVDFTTEDIGKTIKIRVVPYNKPRFVQFIEYMLKIGYFSNRIDIGLAQQYYYDNEHRKCFHYWEITLVPQEYSDLDGFVDGIRIFEGAM